MSRPLTLEQTLLANAEKKLSEYSLSFDQKLTVLEAYAAKAGGFEVELYWETFGLKVYDHQIIMEAAEALSVILATSGIPASLAIASLSREPISISDKKENGAFYTDFRLAQFVAEECRYHLSRESSIADIAAGSGILLAAVAELYFEQYPENYDQWISEKVFAYDLSAYALRGSRIALATHASSVESIKKMCENWRICDSLLAEEEQLPKFDIVVGNPPWGKVKLSRHSFVNKTCADYHIYGSEYGAFDESKFLSEKQNALDYSRTLRERYSLLGNAEPDMYMAFLQKAISILKLGGHLSYIVPAGLIRSLGTEPLRRYLIAQSEVLKYYLLDNKSNFFEIDTRFKFVVVSLKKVSTDKHHCVDFAFEICKGSDSCITGTEEIKYDVEELESIRPDLTIPECRNNAEKELFKKICKNGRLWKNEWSADVSREVDMTNDRPFFHKKCSDTDIPVIEGRMVQQFRFGAKAYVSGSGRSAKWVPNVGELKAQFFISPEDIGRQLFDRIKIKRAGYCDIAGQTNERAMMSAVIPDGVVCGNKVPTIVFPNDDGANRLYFFIGVTNSFVFDWILRRIISTTVNYFLLFSIPMPDIDLSDDLAKRIISLSKELSDMRAEFYDADEMGQIRAELDIAVAKAYKLDFADLEIIMKDFPLLDRQQPTINGESRSTFTRDLLLSVGEKRYGLKAHTYTDRMNEGRKKQARAYIPTEMTALSKGGVV